MAADTVDAFKHSVSFKEVLFQFSNLLIQQIVGLANQANDDICPHVGRTVFKGAKGVVGYEWPVAVIFNPDYLQLRSLRVSMQ